MPRSLAARADTTASLAIPDDRPSSSSLFQGVLSEKKKKNAVISFLLEPARRSKTKQGVRLLKETKVMLKEIKDKLDPETRRRFDARIEEVMAIASDLQKDKGVWPEFIYFYIINPRRLKDAADLLFTEVEVTSSLLASSSSDTETEGSRKTSKSRVKAKRRNKHRVDKAPTTIPRAQEMSITPTGSYAVDEGGGGKLPAIPPLIQHDFRERTDQEISSVDSTNSIEPQQATASDIANLIALFGGDMDLRVAASSYGHGESGSDESEITDSESSKCSPREDRHTGADSERLVATGFSNASGATSDLS